MMFFKQAEKVVISFVYILIYNISVVSNRGILNSVLYLVMLFKDSLNFVLFFIILPLVF